MAEHDQREALGHVQRGGEVGPVRLPPCRGVVQERVLRRRGRRSRVGRAPVGDGVSPRVQQLRDHPEGVVKQRGLAVGDVLHHELHEA